MAAATASVLVFGAGCGGDDSDDSSESSPLDEYFGDDAISFEGGGMSISSGSGEGDAREPTEEELQQQRDFQDAVAECMGDQGFEYVPNVITPGEYDAGPWEEAYSLPDDEFREQHGYGVSTLYFDRAEEDLPEDPNQEIRDGLSPQAQQEYDEALHGTRIAEQMQGTAMPSESPAPPTDEELGCYGVASEEVYDESMTQHEDPFAEFDSLMNDIFQIGERMRNDPRIEAATEDWRNCMADAGYPDFERPGDPEQQVFRRWDELMGWSEAMPPEDDEGEADATSTAGPIEPNEIDPDEREEFQQYELDLAQADYSCLEDHYNEVAEEVQFEIEEEFVEEHRSELEQYRDAMAERDESGEGAAG